MKGQGAEGSGRRQRQVAGGRSKRRRWQEVAGGRSKWRRWQQVAGGFRSVKGGFAALRAECLRLSDQSTPQTEASPPAA